MSTPESLIDMPLSSEEGAQLAPPLKVSELVALLKRDIEHQHRHVRVVGEVASFKQWHSGHCYFDIKDESALIPAVMFKPHAARVPFKVSDGQQILFIGRVSVYVANAKLQMVVESMEPLGQGALALAFLQLKERLMKEGLFDPAHKKPLKTLNRSIGLVTSSHGAAIRDMVTIIRGRLPQARIILAPVRVQGIGAKEEIASAIRLLDQSGECDVIIVGRGGGSLEDLWAFNEELVARAIFSAKTPIISAVGHETDTTISDFVADVRAATPTHGAMLAAVLVGEILGQLQQAQETLSRRHSGLMDKLRLALAHEKRRLRDPRVLLFRHWQRLDELFGALREKMARSMKGHRNELQNASAGIVSLAPWRMLASKKQAFFALQTSFHKLHPKARLTMASLELMHHRDKLKDLSAAKLSAKREAFLQNVGTLEALSPLSVLKRGFSVVIAQKSGKLLTAKSQIKINDTVDIRLQDGAVKALITSME